MKVWFLTGNEGKVREAKKIFNQYNFELEQMNLDFLEPQVESLEEVAKEKMKQAMAILPEESGRIIKSYSFTASLPLYIVYDLGNKL